MYEHVIDRAHIGPGTTVLEWTHRPHPAVIAQVDDAVRAAAAACLVEEMLLEVRAGGATR